MTSVSELLTYVYDLRGHPENCSSADQKLAEGIKELTDFSILYYYISTMQDQLPHTKAKFNELLEKFFEDDKDLDSYPISMYNDWIDVSNKKNLLDKWANDNYKVDSDTILELLNDKDVVGNLKEKSVEILDKFLKAYRKNKSQKNIDFINGIYLKTDPQYLDDICKVISKSTPAVSVNLLNRSDIKDEYILAGLKSLSKLSSQRDIDHKIDFKLLEKLGPRGRLDTMKHLFGLLDYEYQNLKSSHKAALEEQVRRQSNTSPNSGNRYSYHRSYSCYLDPSYYENKMRELARQYMPFKKMPSKQDIDKFLFPCSLKYNEEVKTLVERYDDIIQYLG